MIVDPWGEVLADDGEGPGYIIARIDPVVVSESREKIPALEHDRAFELRLVKTPQPSTGTAG